MAAFVCDENVLIDNSIRNLTSDEIKIITSYTNTGVQQWLSEHSSATTTRSKISYVCPICLPVGVKELAVKKGLVDYLSLTHHILAGIQLATLTGYICKMCKRRYVYERSLVEHRKDVDVCKRWYSDQKERRARVINCEKGDIIRENTER